MLYFRGCMYIRKGYTVLRSAIELHVMLPLFIYNCNRLVIVIINCKIADCDTVIIINSN